MMNIESFHENLRQTIQLYQNDLKNVLVIQENTKTAFQHITDILDPISENLLECINLDNLLNIFNVCGNTETLNDIELAISALRYDSGLVENSFRTNNEIHKENPTIAIVGSVKAGKSTLVNLLLRKNVVRQAHKTCTARLTRITYSEENYVELVNIHDQIIERKKLKNKPIPKYIVELNDEDRSNPDEVNKLIRVGIKSKFLKSGIDLIDSPGLNENHVLNLLISNIINKVLPVMIYVIDGQTSVKQTDISNILSLKVSIPNLNIIYFITRLDTDDVSELIENDHIKTAKDKLDFTFRKLQRSNLIPKTFNHYSECHNFHGASLYSYMDYCNKIKSQETDFHNEQFCKFESDLNRILSENFEREILTATKSLIDFQMDVLTKIISRAKQFVDFTNENLDEIFTMRKVEERLHNDLKSEINNSKPLLIDRLMKRLDNESDLIIDLIADMEFPKSIIIPENKAFTKKNAKFCQKHIIDLICKDLDNLIDNFVQDELNKNFENCFEAHLSPKIINKLKLYSCRLSNKSPYRLCLERNLTKYYKYDLLGLKIKNSSFSIWNFLKNIITGLFRSDLSNDTFDINSRHWRIGQTKIILNLCDKDLLAKNICNNMLHDLNVKHDRFLMNLEKEFKVIQKEINLSETIRDKISNETSSFTLLLMRTLDLQSKYLMKDSVEKEMIGQGSQGTVYRCVCNGKEYAKKKIIVPTDLLETISEEVYYSYLFEHPNLLPLIAVTVNDNIRFDCIEISIYTPLMKIDLENYMKKNILTLEQQLKISLEVANALKYIHNQNIMHRDLKLANILLDEQNNVYLADYGFCKSLALSNYSFVGTFVHIAPEIVRQSKYDQKIDIYSFGMLLWYLAKGDCEPPLFANCQSTTVKVLLEVTNKNVRPERLENIPDNLWDLMNECWDQNPSNRPNINSIISTIQDLLSEIFEKK